MCLTASEVLNCNFTWTFVFTTSAGWVIREASTPARTPQLKLARGAEADPLISGTETVDKIHFKKLQFCNASVDI